MVLVKCNTCNKLVETDLNARFVFCSNGHLISEKKINKFPIKKLGLLKEGIILCKIPINKVSKKNNNTGEINHKGYHIYVNNARLGEIVDIKIERTIVEKGIGFARVVNYRKTVGKRDFQREFNCPNDRDPIGTGSINSLASGGTNRKKGIIIYPEERERKNNIKKKKKNINQKKNYTFVG